MLFHILFVHYLYGWILVGLGQNCFKNNYLHDACCLWAQWCWI